MGNNHIIQIQEYHRYAFMSAFCCGMITNLYMFTNKISFHDDIGSLYSVGTTFKAGRWMLGILGKIIGKLYGLYSMPVLGGFISIVFIAFTSMILVDVLEIHSKISCVLAGSIMAAFPSVCGVFAYMYTAPYYFFALCITAAAVYLIKYNNGWFVGLGG